MEEQVVQALDATKIGAGLAAIGVFGGSIDIGIATKGMGNHRNRSLLCSSSG